VIYTFLSLEGQVAALLVEAQVAWMPDAGEMMAGRKAELLRLAAKGHRQAGDVSLAQAFTEAADAFQEVTRECRNALAHARLSTVSRSADGVAVPGLAMAERRMTTPEELLELASRIEEARVPVTDARQALRPAA
jgi:hypothetical protein